MTRQTAYRRLRKFRGKASLDVEGRIDIVSPDWPSFHPGTCCPLGALMDGKFEFPLVSMAVAELGLSHDDAQAILWASDLYPGYDPRVRAALLRNLGLEERQ